MAEKALKQGLFAWEGTDKRGNRVKGESRAASQAMIKADLRRQGITPIKVRKKSALASASKKKKILPKDIAIFTRQLATMMSAGVPLVQAFEIIGKGHENPAMQDLVLTIKNDVEAGNNLRDALAKHPLYFDELVCNLVEAGEAAGVLDTLLDKIATYKEKTEALKSKIKKALFYPTAVMVVAFIVTAILLIFVVPQFQDLFKGFGADLPAFTQMVIGLSEFMQAYWWAIFGALGIAGYAFVQAKKRSRKFNHALDRLVLKLPIVGAIMTKAAIARYARTLSTMFAAGVPLVEALESVSGATGNSVYMEGVLRMRDNVATGQQLQLAMQQTGLFPNMVVQMVAIGEESGSLDSMLGKVADFYEQEVDDAVDGLSSLLEPLIMAVLGVLVGGLVIAMYLPIFKMGSVV
ncbi:type II secretion system F family protein [Thiohalobacter sp. IOR34]|uniref:type II secretion system F family protein n=1 Tax=Thiohalobacter sp. IOR34 TaxID=3057176 RepID=UPI0025B05455|nr:type II secretion system F family protein [Thiohalobacter sp. IOR34]WJW74934.1 type II secretion system F family protein [Thiohalobacter sp. IOR34]